MDIEDILKKVVTNISNIFTSKKSDPDTIMTSPVFDEASNFGHLEKFLIRPDAFARFFPANDDKSIVINDDYAFSHDNSNKVTHVAEIPGDIYLTAPEIENLGGKLIIKEHQASSINFEDGGWMKIRNEDLKFIDESLDDHSYDNYIHESGVVLQVDQGMETNFWEYDA